MRGVEIVYLHIVAEECVTVDSARVAKNILKTEGLKSGYGQGQVVGGQVARTRGFVLSPPRQKEMKV
jgi:hypothetical protein